MFWVFLFGGCALIIGIPWLVSGDLKIASALASILIPIWGGIVIVVDHLKSK